MHASCMVSCTADDDHSKIHIGKDPSIYICHFHVQMVNDNIN